MKMRASPWLVRVALMGIGLLSARSASLSAQPVAARSLPPSAPDRLSLHVTFSEGLERFRVRQRSSHLRAVPAGARQLTLQIHAAAAAGSALELRLGSAYCEPVACEAEWEAKDWGLLRLRFARPWSKEDALRLHVTFSGRVPRLPASPRIEVSGAGDPMSMLRGLTRLLRREEPSGHGVVGRDDAVLSLPWPHALPVRGRPVRGVRFGDLGPGGLLDVSAELTLPRGVRPVATGLERPMGPGRWRVEARSVRGFVVLLSERWTKRCASLASLGEAAPERPPPKVCVWTVRFGEEEARHLLQTAISALAFFEGTLGPYPWDHLDVVEQRLLGGAGGVEHAGLVTVSPLPVRGSQAGGAARLFRSVLRFVTVHEVAHQWWFALVGSDARQEPVLDEALAQWSTLRYFREVEGAARWARERDRMVLAGWWLHRLEGGADGAAARPLAAFPGMRAYAGLVYGKAPMLFDALEGVLGVEGLQRALGRYARRFRFREARVADLREVLLAGLDARRAEQVRTAMRRWWFEAHGDEDLGPPSMERLLAPWIAELLAGASSADAPAPRPASEPASGTRPRSAARPRVSRDARDMLRRAVEALGGL